MIRLNKEIKFSTGDRVWHISPNGIVRDTTIRLVNAQLIKNGKTWICCPTSYECVGPNYFRDGVLDFSFREGELYRNKRTAQRNAKFIPVNFSEDEWYAAIGLKNGINRINYNEECDLPPCCSIISDIRSILDEIRQHKGVIMKKKRELQTLLNKHQFLGNNSSKLFDILQAIGVTWTT
jgi:hypothetical protein